MQNEMREKLVEILYDLFHNTNFPTMERIADHLIENGAIVLPCKVGDTVYTIFERKIEALEIVCSSRKENNPDDVYEHYDARNDFLIMPFSDCHIGKTVFLTKEEAEQKLKGGNE